MKKIIPLSDKVNSIIVDDEYYGWLNHYFWDISPGGYAIVDKTSEIFDEIAYPRMQMSRLIFGLKRYDTRVIDHINHLPYDNRLSNLRICTQSQNMQNQKPRKGCLSKYKGVTQSKNSKKWMAKIKINTNEKQKHLGSFSTENYAAYAYNLAAKRYFGQFALLNVVQ